MITDTISKPKHRYVDALKVAIEIHSQLKRWCLPGYCKVAGSLRRGKAMVSDIELLYVPQTRKEPDGLFETQLINLTDVTIDEWLRDGYLEKRPSKLGSYAWGGKNKLAVHVESGTPVDLFATTIENWWVSLVIRTGSKETNLQLTTGAQKQGATLNAYGNGVTWSDNTHTAATSEEHVFELCGVPYKEPRDR